MSHMEGKKGKKKTAHRRPNPDTVHEEEMKKYKPKGTIAGE